MKSKEEQLMELICEYAKTRNFNFSIEAKEVIFNPDSNNGLILKDVKLVNVSIPSIPVKK